MAALVGGICFLCKSDRQTAFPSGLDRQTGGKAVRMQGCCSDTTRHAGDKPTSHEAAGAPEKRCSDDGHQHGNVGISRQIKDESVKVETLHSYVLGQRQSYHHDSQRFESMRLETLR